MWNIFARTGVTTLVLSLGLLTGCAQEPIPVPTGASAPCADLTYQGFPRLEIDPPLKAGFFVCHSGFALQYAKPLHSALWAVQRLDAQNLDETKATREREKFRPDGFLPAGLTPSPDRFSNSGYDRGHLAPAADFKENPAGMSQSFYTSNIVPQHPDNNRHIWARLEKNTRAWAMQKGQVYVITGPVFFAGGRPFTPQGWLSLDKKKVKYVIEEYDHQETEVVKDENGRKKRVKKKKVPPEAIAVPSHMYKVIYDPKANTAIAFVIPNTSVPENALPQYATTVAEVERVTSLRFFPDLPFEQQRALKTQVNAQAWILSQ
jgi:endonuclease G